jgi:signal transduction histidine kinase
MSDPAPPTSGRRSRRDWAVDISLFVLAALFGLLGVTARHNGSAPVDEPSWVLVLDQVVGALGCVALWLRRRWPTQLAVALVLASAFAETVGGAMLVALFTVAIHRTPARTALVFGLSVASAVCFVLVRPDPDATPAFLVLMLGVTAQSAAVGWGLFIRHRRQLISTLQDRAARAEAEADLRAEQAQRAARDDIAREIHDVLGHRLSLLSLHAGALEYRPGAPAEEIARAATVIRENAHQALQDLREVVGVLRAPSGQEPQPTSADLPQLVAESRQAGLSVTLREDLSQPLPEPLGRTVYRIVQESLTNARRHAPGSAVTVALTGGPGRGLDVEVGNGPTESAAPDEDQRGSGRGLVGLRERVGLAQGRLDYGRRGDGGWRVAVWLPWPA